MGWRVEKNRMGADESRFVVWLGRRWGHSSAMTSAFSMKHEAAAKRVCWVVSGLQMGRAIRLFAQHFPIACKEDQQAGEGRFSQSREIGSLWNYGRVGAPPSLCPPQSPLPHLTCLPGLLCHWNVTFLSVARKLYWSFLLLSLNDWWYSLGLF